MSMFRLAVIFLILGLLAGMLGFGGVGASAVLLAKLAIMAWLLKGMFIIFVLLAGAFFIKHLFIPRDPPSV